MMRKLVIVLALFGIVGTSLYPATATAPNKTIKEKLEEAGDAVDQANAEVAKALRDYNQVAAKLKKAEANLGAAKAALGRAKNEDQVAQTELVAATNATQRAQNKLQMTQVTLNSEEGKVTLLIKAMYRQGPMSELALIIGSDSPSDFTSRIASIQSWYRDKNAEINSLMKTREDLTQLTSELKALEANQAVKKQIAEEKVLTAAEATAKAEAAQKEVNRLVKAREAVLKEARKFQAETKRRYAKLKKEQDRIRNLANQNGNAGNDANATGKLIWPVKGAPITSHAGWRIHPIFKYRRCHAGTDIGAPTGRPIRVVDSGIVVGRGVATGYGNYIMVSHGKGMVSFYAHLSRYNANKNDRMVKGETIAFVGTSGWSTGPHLHLEIRLSGQTWDPMGWYGRPMRKVC